MASVSTLLKFEGTPDANGPFLDETGKTWSVSGLPVFVTDPTNIAGSTEVFFSNANPDYIYTAAHADFDLGTGDFTIQGWIQTGPTTDKKVIFSVGNVAATEPGSYELYITNGSENGYLGFVGRGATQFESISVENNVTTNWGTGYFVSIIRTGGRLKLYVNGDLYRNVAATSTVALSGASSGVRIGCKGSGLDPYYGRINEFRVVKGQALVTTLAEAQAGFSLDLPAEPATATMAASIVPVSEVFAAHGVSANITAQITPIAAVSAVYGEVTANIDAAIAVVTDVSLFHAPTITIDQALQLTTAVDFVFGYRFEVAVAASLPVVASFSVSTISDPIGFVAVQLPMTASFQANFTASTSVTVVLAQKIQIASAFTLAHGVSSVMNAAIVPVFSNFTGVNVEASIAAKIRPTVSVSCARGVAAEINESIRVSPVFSAYFVRAMQAEIGVAIPLDVCFYGSTPAPEASRFDSVFVLKQSGMSLSVKTNSNSMVTYG